MVQIVKRKKGRPSKADLTRRFSDSPEVEPVARRSHRLRNVRYNIDYDDYLDDEYDDEEEDEKLQKKLKLKLVVKLNHGGKEAEPELRGPHALTDSESQSEDESERKLLKKRRIGRVNKDDEKEEDGDDGENLVVAEDEDEDNLTGRQRTKIVAKGSKSVPGTPSDTQSGIPLPDKKTLELILDKLQKKDIYGVYAEAVDPDELPDYHDVIEHPMDFATVRKKLASGAYSTLENFATDIFLICSNAMQYNAPETIYYKQAHTIQELAKKKFERLRVDYEGSEKELKLEQKTKSNHLVKKLVKKLPGRIPPEPIGSDFSSGATLATVVDVQKSNHLVKKLVKKLPGRIPPEPIGSDFSSGATLATVVDVQNCSYPTQGGDDEKNGNVDGHVEGNTYLFDNNLEKAEESVLGKGFLSRLGRKPVLLDENRRATYNISNQTEVRSESILSTFDGEMKQLVAVGLHAEYSYARSLARFAATIGPVAWKVASKRIEQALPDGCKFGLGWVGEYEPLPTPVLIFENHNLKEFGLFPPWPFVSEVMRRNEKFLTIAFSSKENIINGPNTDMKQSLLDQARRDTSDVKPVLFAPGGIKHNLPLNAAYQLGNLQSNNFSKPSKMNNQFELNLLPTPIQNNADPVSEKQCSNNSQSIASRSTDSGPVKMSLLPCGSFKLPDSNGAINAVLPNGKRVSDCLNTNPVIVSSDSLARVAACSSHGQEQGLVDPVQLMRSLSEKFQRNQIYSNHGPAEAPPVMAVECNTRKNNECNNASMAAARAWMSVGAGGFKKVTENPLLSNNHISADSLYNPAREFNPQITQARVEPPSAVGNKFHSEKNGVPLQTSLSQPVCMGNEAQLRNQPIVFPQLSPRFQLHPHWQGLSPRAQTKKKPEMLPPDLNIGFQSSSSPVRQSSGVQMESQQPDLALQL